MRRFFYHLKFSDEIYRGPASKEYPRGKRFRIAEDGETIHLQHVKDGHLSYVDKEGFEKHFVRE